MDRQCNHGQERLKYKEIKYNVFLYINVALSKLPIQAKFESFDIFAKNIKWNTWLLKLFYNFQSKMDSHDGPNHIEHKDMVNKSSSACIIQYSIEESLHAQVKDHTRYWYEQMYQPKSTVLFCLQFFKSR